MDPLSIMEAFRVYGPIAIVVFLGIAYWRKDTQLNEERKERDKQYIAMTEQLFKLVEANTEANIKLESAIDHLGSGLTGLQNMIMKILKVG